MMVSPAIPSSALRRPSRKGPGFHRKNSVYEVYQDYRARNYLRNFFCVEVHGQMRVLVKDPLYIFKESVPFLHQTRLWALCLTESIWFDRLIIGIIFINAIIMAFPVSYDSSEDHPTFDTILFVIQLITVVIFASELMCKVVSYGLLFGDAPHPSYLRDPWNWLDLTVVVTSFVELSMMKQTASEALVVRCFRILRPLRSIHQLPHLRVIVTALVESIPMLGHWIILACIVLIVFAIAGNNLFSVVYWQRCRLTAGPVVDVNGSATWPIDPLQTRFCGGRYQCAPTADGHPTFCGSPVAAGRGIFAGYNPWPEIDNNPAADYGYTGFQNFWTSLLTVFQMSSVDGWSELMYRFQDGKGTVLAAIFCCTVVLVNGLVLMNLVLAILWERFDEAARKEHAINLDVKKRPFLEIPDAIMNMKLHELVRAVSALETEREKKLIFLELDSAKEGINIKNIFFTICVSPTFNNGMLCVIIVNGIVLAMDSHPPLGETVVKLAEKVNSMCTVIFMVECCIKILGLGFNYFRDYFNTFDFALVLISTAEFVSAGESAVSALRISRLLRIFRAVRAQVSIRVLLQVLRKAVIPTSNFCLIVLIVLYCLALLGLQMFFVPGNGQSGPQVNFSGIIWAWVSVFTLLVGDKWMHVMISLIQAGAKSTQMLLYFLSSYILCHMVLMNLFLGILAAAFASARDELMQDYRYRWVECQKPIAISTSSNQNEQPQETEEEDSPVWPDEIFKRRAGRPKVPSRDMHLLKMITLKRAAADRAHRGGGIVYEAPDETVEDACLPGASESLETQNTDEGPIDESRGPERLKGSIMKQQVFGTPVKQKRSEKNVSFVQTDAQPPTEHYAVNGLDVELPSHPATVLEPSPVHQTVFPSTDDFGEQDVEGPPPVPFRFVTGAMHQASPPLEGTPVECLDCKPCVPRLRLDQFRPEPIVMLGKTHAGMSTSFGLRRRTRSIGGDRPQVPSFRELVMQAKLAPHSLEACATPVDLDVTEFERSNGCPIKDDFDAHSVCEPQVPPTLISAPLSTLTLVEPKYESWVEVTADLERCTAHDSEGPVRTAPQILDAAQHLAAAPEQAAPNFDIEGAVPQPSRIRRRCQKVVSSRFFEPCVIFTILFACAGFALENTDMNPRPSQTMVSGIILDISAIFFLIEMLVKMIAFGLFKLPTSSVDGSNIAYFRSGWNVIDFSATLTCIVDLVLKIAGMQNKSIQLVRIVRMLRIARPIQLMKYNRGIKVLVETLIGSIPTLANMLLITLLFYVGFGILFVNLMKGSLGFCSLDPQGKRADIVTRVDCTNAGGSWMNSDWNFDHLGNSVMTLMQLCTSEGWIEVMLKVVNTPGIDVQPRRNHDVRMAFLIVITVAIGNFVLVNLFIGVLVDHYLVTRGELLGLNVVTIQERRWLELQRNVFFNPALLEPMTPDFGGPNRQLQQALFRIVHSRLFEFMANTFIVANTVLMCISHPTETDNFREGYEIGMNVLTVLFNIEVLMRFLAYWTYFLRDGWNIFDLAALIASNASLLADFVIVGDVADMLRVFRVARVLRLMRTTSFLRAMLRTVCGLVPGLLHVASLLGLVTFMYTCLGVGLFGTLADHKHLNSAVNFHSFGSALLVLMRVATGEQWHLIMYSVVKDAPGCVTHIQSREELERYGPRGCGSVLGYPYFVSFVFVVTIILMNLIIAVVLDGFAAVQQIEATKDYEELMKVLKGLWCPSENLHMHLERAAEILAEIPEPVGFGGRTARHCVHLMRNIPLNKDKEVHFQDIAIFCAKRSYLWLNGEPERELRKARFDQSILNEWCSHFDSIPIDGTGEMENFVVAHAIIQRFFVQYMINAKQKMKHRPQIKLKITGQARIALPETDTWPVLDSARGAAAPFPLDLPSTNGSGASCAQYNREAAQCDQTKKLLPEEFQYYESLRQQQPPQQQQQPQKVMQLTPQDGSSEQIPQLSPLPWPPLLPLRSSSTAVSSNPAEHRSQ